MTKDEQRAYARGYQRGAKWPDHKPPTPPDRVLRSLVRSLRELRDVVDSELATFGSDDPIEDRLGPLVESADKALAELGAWLKSQELEEFHNTN